MLCFDTARGRWYFPDLSHGNVAMLVESNGEWPISGDRLRTRERDSLIHYVDWQSLEEE